MSQTTARRMVVIAGVVMLGTLALKKTPSFRAIWAAAVIVLVLSFFSDFVPTIAGPFAIIIALSVGFTQGGLLEWLGGTVGGGGGARTATAATGSATRSSTAATPSPATFGW